MTALPWLTARPIAHRGLHDAAPGIIENTTTAFKSAIAAGYGIETDLQISVDGEAMVHHDDALGRLTDGHARLADLTAADLRRVRFKATGDPMLALTDLCELVGRRVPLLLELKSHYDGDGRLPARVAAILADYAGPVAVMSFDPFMVSALGRFAPRLARGLTAELKSDDSEYAATLTDLIRCYPHFVAYSARNLPAALPLMARYLLGKPLLTWTVRGPDERLAAMRYADQIIFEGFRA